MKLLTLVAIVFVVLLGYVFFEKYKDVRARRALLSRVKARGRSINTMVDPDPTTKRRDRKEDYTFRSVR